MTFAFKTSVVHFQQAIKRSIENHKDNILMYIEFFIFQILK